MKKIRKKVTILLLMVLLFNSLGVMMPVSSADAPKAPLELSLPSDLTDWILDEDAGYIYAISSGANNLYFIRLGDFAIEKTINVGSNPIYLAKEGQFLHIALSGATIIKTVDLSTHQVSDTITTSAIPTSVAASSNDLFYGTGEGKIYKFNKTTRTNSLLFRDSGYYNLTLAFDEPTNTLYAGNLSSYGGIVAINADTGAKLSQDIDDNMEIGGSTYSLKHIFIDDQSVYFGGHQFNKENLIETTGTYSRTDAYSYLESVIVDVTDSYVLTTQGVYDKSTYTPLILFSSNAAITSNQKFALLDSNGNAYLAGIENWFTESDKIKRIDLTIPQRTSALFTTDTYSITSDQAITDWTTTDHSPYIYAIMASTNELAIIRKGDMSVEKKMFIGSNPSKIKIFNNKAYVIFKGENHINVMDLNDGIPTDASTVRITTKNYPLDVFPDNNNRILYNGGVFYGGISVTSATYTSVSDMVYNEKSTGIYNQSSYMLDSNQEVLYAGDSSYLLKYNSQNFNLLERSSVEGGYYSNILLDENNLIYGQRRYDANQISSLYGTYPETVIYARGSYVFSKDAVYDRDSFTKISDLFMSIRHAYVDANQTIFISTDKRLYKFSNIEEMKTIMIETRLPSNAIFIDEDLMSDRIDGYLFFEPPIDQDGIIYYSGYYLDQNGNKLKELGLFKNTELSTDSLFIYEVVHSTLPEGAVSIGLYPVVRYDYGSIRTLDINTSVPIYDAPNYLPVDLSVSNIYADTNKFAGTVTWKPGTVEIPSIRYYLYFVDEDGVIGDELAVVNGGQAMYSVTISEKDVPEEAIGIGLFMSNDDFTSPFYVMEVLKDERTPAILASSIMVHNYEKQADKIVVSNLTAGDIIRVYKEGQTSIIGSVVVAPNQNAATITINNLGNPGDKLLLTRQATNLDESTGTLVIVPPVTNDNIGGGFGGGGGPGGGNTTLDTKIVVNKDGTRSSTTVVTSAFVSTVISGADFKKNPVITIKADEKTATQSSQFEIDLSTLISINNNSKDAVLILESTSGKLQLPVNTLLSSLSQDGSSKQKVVITIAKAAIEYKTKLSTQLNSPASVPLGDPIEYEIKLIGDGPDRIISNLSDYIDHVISFSVAKEADAVYAGLTYDSITKKYVPVPTTWEWKDGVLQVTMKRKGNSVYTVVKNLVEFNDLDNSNPYKDSILALANRMVIDGYTDGSFKAESVVTRAEFAAMLNRALGILPRLQASKSFTDVTNGVWYASHVNAAVDAGLINGYKDGTFRPNQEITHQEMVAMLVNALKYIKADTVINKNTSDEFPVNLPEWAKPYYATAMNNGILPTNNPFQFQSDKNTQRQESALLLYQLMKVLKLTNA
ncbi:S-layer homology domain-containing protein [Cohnella sp. WQ 127256]|uniref:S-layer homology domain-containing protein n=1 Tax=Cohnella sp. WQ 127256 TaxID=2938790 RepID=UPI002117D3DE|nr:S-layer homology domain-containing protein [Cohnella sp. WQ 127256]